MRARWTWLILPLLLFDLLTYVGALSTFVGWSLHPNLGMAQVGRSWTVANYRAVLGSAYYRHAFAETLYLSLLSTAIALLLAYPVAYWLVRAKARWKGAAFVTLVASSYTSVVVRTLGWEVILGTNGPANRLLMALHLSRQPLHLVGNLTGATIGLAHVFLPQMVLLLMASIQAVDPALERAAHGLGASRWRVFLRIVLPLTWSGIVAASILVFALVSGTFTTPSLLGGGRLGTVPVLVAGEVVSNLNYPVGATLSVVLLALVLLLVWGAGRTARTRA